MNKITFEKELKPLYTARNNVEEIENPRGVYLAIDGVGAPGGEAYGAALEALYATTYTLKFQLKTAGVVDFKVPRLEALYYDPPTIPMDDWRWRLMLRVPDDVGGAEVKAARKAVREKKGLDVSGVRRVSWKEGKALQTLHVGPYSECGEAWSRVHEAAVEHGYRERGPGHEVYLSDPGRTDPEKLRTIVRMPISHPRPTHARGKQA